MHYFSIDRQYKFILNLMESKSQTPTQKDKSSVISVDGVPSQAVDFIVGFEKCHLKGYPCPSGIPTIGYGNTHYSTGKPVKIGDIITKEQAKKEFSYHLGKKVLPKVEKIEGWNDMNENQRSAIISFAYNVGENFYGHSEYKQITDALKNRRWDEIPRIMNLYNKGGGVVLPGLIRRRKGEGDLWSRSPAPPQSPSQTQTQTQTPPQTPPPQTENVPEPQVGSGTYIIQPGDVLSVIAQKISKERGFKITEDDLAKLNEIPDKDKISAGRELKIPENPNAQKQTATAQAAPKPELPAKQEPKETKTPEDIVTMSKQELADMMKQAEDKAVQNAFDVDTQAKEARESKKSTGMIDKVRAERERLEAEKKKAQENKTKGK